ncbi:MAG: ribosome biogenesis GTPase Der [Alphaproteobacteria bacterium]|nr:ribosome biogenesis GTPase Der [Alphaproteobacteria bacterium]
MKLIIAGRPNTGKSTIFNVLTKSRDSLVHDRPGVTRDIVSGTFDVGDLTVQLSDTAGLESGTTDIGKIATDMSLSAVRDADAILFVVDGKDGLVPADTDWARVVRRENKGAPVLLLVNKTEGKKLGDLSEFYKLGMGDPVRIAAEHKIGFDEIYEFINRNRKQEAGNPSIQCPVSGLHRNSPLRISIMGQPNVGKSTLVNYILGDVRVIVKDEPGITRDTIRINTNFMGRPITIVDTAGLRKKANITDDVETLSALKSLDAIGKTDIVILVVDATRDIENQAMGIAGRIYDAGKILIVALNKWDLVSEEDREYKLLKLKKQFNKSFHQIISPIILPISAERGTGVRNLMKRTFALYDISETSHATSYINRTLEKLLIARQPPMSRLKRPMKIKFAAQTGRRPMRITINTGGASDIPESYTRYLKKGIAKALNWEALPIVIDYKTQDNPYES